MAEDEKPTGNRRGPDSNRRGSLIALGVIVLLFVIGWILVQELHSSEQLQDCLLSGRTNCAPITQPTH